MNEDKIAKKLAKDILRQAWENVFNRGFSSKSASSHEQFVFWCAYRFFTDKKSESSFRFLCREAGENPRELKEKFRQALSSHHLFLDDKDRFVYQKETKKKE